MAGKGTLGLLVGGIAGAIAGVAAGVLLAPRAGSESRAMAADAMNDAWDSAVDAYERGSRVVTDKVGNIDATSDELRAKVDLARERMDKLRESLSETVANTTAQVQDAVSNVTDKVTDMAAEQEAAMQTAAEGVRVEVVDDAENSYVEVVDEA